MTDEEKRAEMIRKVQALWAQAEHPNTGAEEAATFRAKAAQMMAKYQINEITLSEGGGLVDDIVFQEIRLTSTKRVIVVSDQLMELMHAIALSNDCRGIILRKMDEMELVGEGRDAEYRVTKAGGSFYQCIGYRKDVTMTRALYAALNLDLFEALLGEKQTDSHQKSFAYGYSQRIEERLGEVRQAREVLADEVGTGMALAIRSKKHNVDDFYREMYPPSQTSVARTKNFHVDPTAANRGRNRASAADLGGGDRITGGAERGSLGRG